MAGGEQDANGPCVHEPLTDGQIFSQVVVAGSPTDWLPAPSQVTGRHWAGI